MPRVIVIGASRGIGLELVRQYAADGWEVLATVRAAADQARLEGIAGVRVALADTTDEASLTSLALTAGAEPFDLLIVNAGINPNKRRLDEVDAATWTQVMTVNALGPVLAIRALSDLVRDDGSIVALSSRLGSIELNVVGGLYSYRMSKAALNMGLMSLSRDLSPRRIRVAALNPGWVKSDMGGSAAPVEIHVSVTGLRRVIADLSAGEPAIFVDYLGNRFGW